MGNNMEKELNRNKDFKLAKKISLITIIINVLLAIIKLIAGILGSSNAMLADGVHTLSDVFTTILVIIGIKIGSKEPDKEHPYGHEKFESVFAKLLSIILVLTGIMIGYNAIESMINKDFVEPERIALFAALSSIIVKEIMYRYTIFGAKKINSTSMEADAWHHRSDALSSIGTFVGILGARLGFPILDPMAGLVVSLLVIKVGVDLYLQSVDELVDKAASKEVIKQIEHITKSVEGVEKINELRTRMFSNYVFVDLNIGVNGDLTVKEGHDIATEIHDKLEKEIKEIKHSMIHVEPV